MPALGNIYMRLYYVKQHTCNGKYTINTYGFFFLLRLEMGGKGGLLGDISAIIDDKN